jgi:hypothetical protein
MVEKTDLFRYAIIYERGGIYCDADGHLVGDKAVHDRRGERDEGGWI